MTLIGRTTLSLAALFILHAAYSTYEHQSHLKALGRPDNLPPSDIIIEALVGMFLGILGASLNAPPLREITWASEMRKRNFDNMDSRLSFASYVNRGQGLGPVTQTQ